ncbi:hypothetical protein GOBAR_DD13119 [Gossypium barbadense]|nr:hypothetical protein GOBAR_DD13119 [Gossypium barbadense]
MNVQSHMSGQISGQFSNQGGLPQQNGNPLQSAQVQNLGVAGVVSAGAIVGAGGPPQNTLNMVPDIIRTREYMQGQIWNSCDIDLWRITPQKLPIEVGESHGWLCARLILAQEKPCLFVLLKTAAGWEKMHISIFMTNAFLISLFVSTDFLKSRYQRPITETSMLKLRDFARQLEEGLFKIARTKDDYTNLSTLEHRLQILMRGSRNAHNQRRPQLVNSTSEPVGMIPTPGNIHNGYQQSAANYCIASGGMSSIGVQRMTSQMIPTPGFSSYNNNSSVNNQSSNNVAGLSTVESKVVSQAQQLKQQVGGQNSHIWHTVGSQMDTGIRSGLQQKTFGFPNGSLNGASGMMGNNLQIFNEPGTSGGYQCTTPFSNLPKPLQGHSDQHQQPLMQADTYGLKHADSCGSGSLLYGAVTSVGSMTNSQNLNPLVSDIRSQVQHEPGVKQHDKVPHQQAPEQFQLPELQNQFQENYADGFSGQQDMRSLLPQNSQEMQHMMHQYQLIPESQNDYKLSAGAHLESVVQSQWHPHSKDTVQMPGNMSHEQHVQEDFCKRISRQDEAQCNELSADGSTIGLMVVPRSSSDPSNPRGAIFNRGNGSHDRQFRNQVNWLLFLRHARQCKVPEGKCDSYCFTIQKLLTHIDTCESSHCSYPRCHHSKLLIRHHKTCANPACPVCVPVNNYVQAQKARACLNSISVLPYMDNGSTKTYSTGDISARMTSKTAPIDTSVDMLPSLKRMKVEQLSQPVISENEGSVVVAESHIAQDIQPRDYQHGDRRMPVKSEPMEIKTEVPMSCPKASPVINKMKDVVDDFSKQKTDGEPITCTEFGGLPNQENAKIEKEANSVKKEDMIESSESAAGTKSGKPKIKGVSLTELFTPEQVREHITGLRRWVGQSKAKAEKNQAMGHSMSENSCQLCAVEKLTFEPAPIYCSPCGAWIKRNAMYYTVGAGDPQHYFCNPCHNESRGDSIWVQCDKCEAWQHQICALFNGRRNDGGQAEYTCPNCYITEVDRGERKPLPQSAVLGAKDLPRTILSDCIEQRLFRRLKQERQERARVQGKCYDEVINILFMSVDSMLYMVPGAEALVIRVVSSVDKKLEVKQRFLEIFQEDNYPTEFPYKSKVVLLFQKIEGVEVCLFGMYIQEFGSECAFPNQRRVYLSYLDSVKYFRPEVKAVTGEALRTFVYHEILKTPKSDKLREWYLAMLRKASKENIVVDLTNFYDNFFVTIGECKAKVAAARLPYFDGDYWPGAAEDLINQLCQQEDGRKLNKKGTTKKTITKRALKASGQSDLSANASKDLLLMHKLGEAICPMKEDFIMVHLQHCCTRCILMVSGNRWVCSQCYEIEQKREERERHPINQREKHVLYPVEITDVPTDTKDKDEILESEFFDTRQAFLNLCQGNHYQYDTLRRAKHSSMMVLYHLHNPTAPAFVTTCNVCHLDIETGQGWRCEPSMAERDAQNKEARQLRVLQYTLYTHAHANIYSRTSNDVRLTVASTWTRRYSFLAVGMAPMIYLITLELGVSKTLLVLSTSILKYAKSKLRKMLDLLVHASQCRSAHCQYPNCRKVKGLFCHGIQCKTRASGGCILCKKMWYLLQLHARACKESECHVPRCRDLKEHLRRLKQQSDSRRRAAVMEMMRQRAAEVAANSGQKIEKMVCSLLGTKAVMGKTGGEIGIQHLKWID